MRRQLSVRELVWLRILVAITLAGGYYLLYYAPITAELEQLEEETVSCEEQIETALLRMEDRDRMKRELEDLFAAGPAPLSIPPYDNLQPVMMELNAILRATQEYSLSFGTVDLEQKVVRRRISLSFVSDSYETAEQVLGQLHDSRYRCVLDDVSVSLGAREGNRVTVSAALVFFEYQ